MATSTARPPALAARQWLRFGLGGLAIQMLMIGVLASIAPHWFFNWFLFGRGWAGAIGPYSEHYVLDLGYTYLGLGLVVGWATVRLTRELCRAAAAASLLANLPHLLFHLNHTHALGLGDNLAQDGALFATCVASFAVLLLLWQHPEAAELPTASELRRPAEQQPVVGVLAGAGSTAGAAAGVTTSGTRVASTGASSTAGERR